MKKFMFICISACAFSLQGKSTNIPLDSIKNAMFIFLKEAERCQSVDEVPNTLIIDRKKGAITEGKEGIFDFGLLVSGARTHYLLIGNNNFRILNMAKPIDINISKLLDFFERNKYSKKDVFFYLRELIDTYRRNEETINSFNGFIK